MTFAGQNRATRWLLLSAWCIACLGLFWASLRSLFLLALYNDDASHILLIPFISLVLLYAERKEFGAMEYALRPGAALLLLGVSLRVFATYASLLDARERLSVNILAFLFFLVAGYVAILGREITKHTWFPLAFLLFAVPLPEALLNWLIHGLQAGSAAVAEVLFDLSGVPVLREGFIFRLPRMSIEVAQECSGIRSSIALMILAVLISHFAFRPLWKKLVFIAAGLVMMLIKNGVRIATLTLLANYVDPDFLYGRLHHQGGVVFFLFGLGILVPVYLWLRRGEPAATVKPGSTPATAH